MISFLLAAEGPQHNDSKNGTKTQSLRMGFGFNSCPGDVELVNCDFMHMYEGREVRMDMMEPCAMIICNVM